MVDINENQATERVFKALASSHRLKILSLVLEAEDVCAKDLASELRLSQPDVSYHLSKLYQAGLLNKDKKGTKNCYHLNENALKSVGIMPNVLLNNEEVS